MPDEEHPYTVIRNWKPAPPPGPSRAPARPATQTRPAVPPETAAPPAKRPRRSPLLPVIIVLFCLSALVLIILLMLPEPGTPGAVIESAAPAQVPGPSPEPSAAVSAPDASLLARTMTANSPIYFMPDLET